MSPVADKDLFDDAVQLTPARRRALITIALGEFVDGYDLIVIGAALLLLRPAFGLTALQLALLSSAAFLGSAIGAAVFGHVADRTGRKKVFVINLAAFIVLALLSASVFGVWSLCILRLLMGIAIGADIAASMSFLAEISPRQSRGGWTGAMPQVAWSLGALASLLIGVLFYVSFGPDSWRLMFAFGAVPPLILLLMRRSLPDSPRWLLSMGRTDEAVAALDALGLTVRDHGKFTQGVAGVAAIDKRLSYRQSLKIIFSKRYVGAALFAIVLTGLTPLQGIGQAVLGPYVFQQFGHMSVTQSILSGGVTWVGALVGACLALATLDRIGRIASIIIALAGYAVVYTLMLTLARAGVTLIVLYFALGVVTWFGSSAWWPLPSELLPTEVRGAAQGIASSLQRVAIGVNTFLVPVLLSVIHFSGTVAVATVATLCLLLYTIVSGPKFEPNGKPLETIQP